MSDHTGWWRDRQEKVLIAAKKMSDEWLAGHPDRTYPDLDFRCPDCPMCLEETRHEDGQFICDVCLVAWPSNGYGHEAEFIGEPDLSTTSPHEDSHE